MGATDQGVIGHVEVLEKRSGLGDVLRDLRLVLTGAFADVFAATGPLIVSEPWLTEIPLETSAILFPKPVQSSPLMSTVSPETVVGAAITLRSVPRPPSSKHDDTMRLVAIAAGADSANSAATQAASGRRRCVCSGRMSRSYMAFSGVGPAFEPCSWAETEKPENRDIVARGLSARRRVTARAPREPIRRVGGDPDRPPRR